MDPYRSTAHVESEAPSPEEQLKALRSERANRKRAREEATKEARLQSELERERRGIEEDEIFAELEDKHGRGFIQRVNTPHGMVVMRAPDPMLYREFNDKVMRSDHPNPKVRTSFYDACEKVAELCVLYPSREEFEKLAKKVPTLISVACDAAIALGKAVAEEDAGK